MSALPKTIVTSNPLHTIRVYRDWYKALNAETKIMIDDTKQLTINTSKSTSGRLVSSASVMHVQPDGSHTMTCFQDFSERITSTNPKKVTEKAILDQHKVIDFGAVVASAEAFYKKQAAELAEEA